jgi:hypothetical protein
LESNALFFVSWLPDVIQSIVSSIILFYIR